MKRLHTLIMVCAILTAFAVPVLITSQPVHAVDVLQGVCDDAALKVQQGQAAELPQACQDREALQKNNNDPVFGADGIITRGLNVLSILVGVIAVIVIIIAGLRLILSGGDSNTVATTRRAIIYSVVGIVVAALAQGIVQFILKRL